MDTMNAEFFTNNRKRLLDKLPGSLIVLTAYSLMQRTNDIEAFFEQESNFWYLTGIEEPDWWVILDGLQNTAWLVVPKISESQRIFSGELSNDDAAKASGIKKTIDQTEADSLLRKLAKRHSVAYVGTQPFYADNFDFVHNPALAKLKQKMERIFSNVQSCNKELAKLRAIKQPVELQAMQRAITITNEALEIVHKKMSNYKYEYEIDADISAHFRRKGTRHGYDPIVAAGKNATVLHYVKNNAKLAKRQLVLFDVGAKVTGYSADIARTFAYGEPTKRQISVHAAVERAQQEVIQLLRPGLELREYLQEVQKIMSREIAGLGLAHEDDEAGLSKYSPHAIGHGLGVDVHDELGRPRYLEEGMVLTVEPGIYIPEEKIGVRIEDDILITKTGHKNMSEGLSTGL